MKFYRVDQIKRYFQTVSKKFPELKKERVKLAIIPIGLPVAINNYWAAKIISLLYLTLVVSVPLLFPLWLLPFLLPLAPSLIAPILFYRERFVVVIPRLWSAKKRSLPHLIAHELAHILEFKGLAVYRRKKFLRLFNSREDSESFAERVAKEVLG